MRSTAFVAKSPAQARGAPRPWKRAILWLAFLGPFFFLSYGFANWWTSRLGHVGSFFFDWERHIPFLDWTILPYMSIDAFYAASLFLCATRAELDTHAKRLLGATVISVAGFLIAPLQFGFVRPATSGFNGLLFDALTGFDKPFNQAPSLHVSLLMLLWVVYARHLRGAARWAMHVWFLLIGVSVFTTYQHHIIDGVAGAVVGVICCYLFPDRPAARIVQASTGISWRGRRLQRLYLFGAGFCVMLACLLRGWAWLLLWPGVALMLVALAYAGYGPVVFQKHAGKLSVPAQVLLFPYRVGAWISSRWFTRNGPPSTEVMPGLWIGRAPGRSDWWHLSPIGLLDLTAEFNASRPALARHYRNVPMLDLVEPSIQQLQQAVRALDELRQHKRVLVHCALGYSRSALVISAWLLERGLAATPEQAVEQVRQARPQIVLSNEAMATLQSYHES